MATPFDPASYQPAKSSSALAGFADAHELPLRRFEDLLSDAELQVVDRALRESLDPQAHEWRRWLIFDACLAAYGSFGAVVSAVGDF